MALTISRMWTFGGRWHFVNRSAFVPFVEVRVRRPCRNETSVILSDEQGNTYAGDLTIMGRRCLRLGGGLQYFMTPGIALGGAFKWTRAASSRAFGSTT